MDRGAAFLDILFDSHAGVGRNPKLLAAAATLAKAPDIAHVVAGIGSRESDRPDDRKQAVDEAINLAMATPPQFHAPLSDLDSAEIRSLATKLGGAKFRDLIRPLR